MSSNTKYRGIFEKGSRTYSNAARFFSPAIQEQVEVLYAFVRTADNYVDIIPQDRKGFYDFVNAYNTARLDPNFEGGRYIEDFVVDSIIKSFIKLERQYEFEPQWTQAFLRSMEMDLSVNKYRTQEDLIRYMYGSAAVIGLYMCKIMGLPKEAYQTAELLGNAFQYINFLRDIGEDMELGRVYIPQDELDHFGLKFIEQSYIGSSEKNTKAFVNMMRAQVETYRIWQREAEKGFSLISPQERVGIKTASDMYKWTAEKIYQNPMSVFKAKIKPSKARILFTGIINKFFN